MHHFQYVKLIIFCVHAVFANARREQMQESWRRDADDGSFGHTFEQTLEWL